MNEIAKRVKMINEEETLSDKQLKKEKPKDKKSNNKKPYIRSDSIKDGVPFVPGESTFEYRGVTFRLVSMEMNQSSFNREMTIRMEWRGYEEDLIVSMATSISGMERSGPFR